MQDLCHHQLKLTSANNHWMVIQFRVKKVELLRFPRSDDESFGHIRGGSKGYDEVKSLSP